MAKSMDIKDWVIKNNGLNCILLLSTFKVRGPEAEAYINLPLEERNNITNIYKKYSQHDHLKIGKVLGFNSKPSKTGILGLGVVMVEYGDKEQIINRSTLEKVCTKKGAKQRIDKFWSNIREQPPEDPPLLCLEQQINNANMKLQVKKAAEKACCKWNKDTWQWLAIAVLPITVGPLALSLTNQNCLQSTKHSVAGKTSRHSNLKRRVCWLKSAQILMVCHKVIEAIQLPVQSWRK